MARGMLAAGALAMALAVALGAVAAHASKGAANPDAARLLQTAVTYHLVHGLALVIEGALARAGTTRWLAAAFALHVCGIVLFCGSLWVLAFTQVSLGPAAPTGGLALIAGWAALAVHAFRMPRA